MAAATEEPKTGAEVDPLASHAKAVSTAEILRNVRFAIEDDEEEEEAEDEHVTALIEFDTLPEVKPEVVDAFMHELHVLLSSFEGFVRQDVIKMKNADGSMKHTVINTFDNYKDLRMWLASKERKVLIENRPFLTQGEFKESMKDGGEDGIDELAMDDLAVREPVQARPPPKWKLATIVWAIAAFYVVLMVEAGIPHGIHKNVRDSDVITTFCVMVLLVPALVYAVTPVLTKIFHFWIAMDRPKYQWEPMRTLDEGVQLFTPHPPVVEKKQVTALEDRIQHLEGAVQRLRAREVEQIMKAKKANAPATQEQVIVDIDAEDQDETAAALGMEQSSIGISAWDVALKHGAGAMSGWTNHPSDPRSYLEKLEDEIAANMSAHHTSKSRHRHAKKLTAVTQVSHLHVKWEHNDDFKRLINSYRKMQKEKFAGFVSLSLLQGKKDGLAPQEYVMICKYQSVDDMKTYATSDQRKLFYRKVKPWLESQVKEVYEQERFMHDAFSELFDEEGHMPHAHPPVWKIVALIILGLTLIAWPVNIHLASALKDWGVKPWWIRTCIQVFVNVFTNTFVGAPFFQFLFGGWLHKPHEPGNPITKILYKGFPNIWIKLVLAILYTAILSVLAATRAFVDEDDE